MRYDKNGDDHYDILSAYQKSMRGSDPDAALHYLARLLEAGDLVSACRRLMVCACEDVGLAWPQIIPIVKAAVDAATMLGLPEGRIPLADAVILVATAPKSNSGEAGINAAMADLQKGRSGPIPRQLQNKHFDGEGRGGEGPALQIPPRLSRQLGGPAVSARRAGGVLNTTIGVKTRPSRRPKPIGSGSRASREAAKKAETKHP